MTSNNTSVLQKIEHPHEIDLRLELAISAAKIGLFDWDLPTDRMVWSPHHYLIFDIDPGTPVDYGVFSSRVHPDDLEAVEKEILIAKKSKVTHAYEFRIVLRNADVRTVSSTSKCVYDPKGKAIRMCGATLDITAASQARQQILRRERQYASLVDSSPDMVMRFSLDMRLSFANTAVQHQLGITPESCVGKRFSEFGQSPAAVAAWDYKLAQVISTHTIQTLEWNLLTATGESRYMYSRFVPELSDNNEVESVICISSDVTPLLMARQSAELSESRFEAMVDAIPQLAWTAHADGFIYWYNKNWYDYTGATQEAMAGWGWQEVHEPATLPLVLEKWKQSIATGKPFEMVFPIKGADGGYRSFKTRAVPIRDASGVIKQWAGTNTALTQAATSNTATVDVTSRNLEKP